MNLIVKTIKINRIQNLVLYKISIGKGFRLSNPLIVFHMNLNSLSKPFYILNVHIYIRDFSLSVNIIHF